MPDRDTSAFDKAWGNSAPASIFNTRRPDDTEAPTEDHDESTEPDPMRRLARDLFRPTKK
jgi:hypothetical protein